MINFDIAYIIIYLTRLGSSLMDSIISSSVATNGSSRDLAAMLSSLILNIHEVLTQLFLTTGAFYLYQLGSIFIYID